MRGSHWEFALTSLYITAFKAIAQCFQCVKLCAETLHWWVTLILIKSRGTRVRRRKDHVNNAFIEKEKKALISIVITLTTAKIWQNQFKTHRMSLSPLFKYSLPLWKNLFILVFSLVWSEVAPCLELCSRACLKGEKNGWREIKGGEVERQSR